MGTITYPNTITAGTVTSAEEVRENLFQAKSTPDSLAVINGDLDWDNLPAAWQEDIPKEAVRRGSFTAPQTGGSTNNLDYFSELFQGDWDETSWTDSRERAVVVAGAARKFRIPWDDCSAVLISFRIEVVVDGGYFYSVEDEGLGDHEEGRYFDGTDTAVDDMIFNSGSGGTNGAPDDIGTYQNGDFPGETRLMLFYDGQPVKGVERRIVDGVVGLATPFNYSDEIPNFNSGRTPYTRHWSCSAIIDADGPFSTGAFQLSAGAADELAKGYHSASIRLSHKKSHVRVRTRHLTVIPIR